jgi:hypothetical protein
MANQRVRLSQKTIDAVAELGDKCGIEDPETVIRLLIRKYGDDLTALLAPTDPKRDSVTQPVPNVPRAKDIEAPAPVVMALPPEEVPPGRDEPTEKTTAQLFAEMEL